jgi:hypothetical protein
LSPTQQPAQFEGSHFEAPHAPDATSHVRPSEAQSTHAAPPTPHALASVPAWHTSTPVVRSQQPRQLSQPGRVHVLLAEHAVKPCCAQSVQLPPNWPHALRSLPVRQAPKRSQQPVGHVWGVHVAGGVVPPSSVSGSRLVRPQPGASTMNTRIPTAATSAARTSEGKRIGGSRRHRSAMARAPVASGGSPRARASRACVRVRERERASEGARHRVNAAAHGGVNGRLHA